MCPWSCLTAGTGPYMCASMRASSLPIAVLFLAFLGIAACGGDNLALCDGCEQATATPTVTTTVTPTVPPEATQTPTASTPTTTPTP